MGKIIAVANQKGGVGKTTSVINLSSCIGRLGKKVLVVDVDPQSNATSGLGVNKATLEKSVYECMIGHVEAASQIIQLPWQGLSILPAKRDLTGAEVELISVIGREHCLANCLKSVTKEYDYIFLDCPPSLGLLTINALTAADSIIMPIQCEYYALEGLGQLMETYQLVRKRVNTRLCIEGIVLTMADLRTNLSQQVEQEVRKHFSAQVYDTVIGRNVRLSEAPGFGKPVIEYDPLSAGAKAYMELAREFLMRNGHVPGENTVAQNETISETISKPGKADAMETVTAVGIDAGIPGAFETAAAPGVTEAHEIGGESAEACAPETVTAAGTVTVPETVTAVGNAAVADLSNDPGREDVVVECGAEQSGLPAPEAVTTADNTSVSTIGSAPGREDVVVECGAEKSGLPAPEAVTTADNTSVSTIGSAPGREGAVVECGAEKSGETAGAEGMADRTGS